MGVRSITDQSTWQEFFNANGSPSFLQSWEWGEMQRALNYDVLRLGVYEEGKLQALSQTITISAKRGKFLFIPHGPIATNYQPHHFKKILKTLLSYLEELAKRESFAFIRMAPVLTANQENEKIFSSLGFKPAPLYMHAERMWVLPLTGEEEDLLGQMRKTTRYLIKKAPRDGVVIEKRTDGEAVEDFWRIYQETAKREKFTPFSKKFISEEFDNFNKTNRAVFLFAKLERQYLASALIIFTKSSAFYHQGASIHTKFPATYLLQWEAIKEAKKRGCLFYNFWGIIQPGRTPKSWAGLTLFKQGFGGHQLDYVATQDFIVSPRYYLTWLYENFLKVKRGI